MEKTKQKKIGVIAIAVAIIAAIIVSAVLAMINQRNGKTTTSETSGLVDSSNLAGYYVNYGWTGDRIDEWLGPLWVNGAPGYCLRQGAHISTVYYQGELFSDSAMSGLSNYYTNINSNKGKLRWIVDNVVLPNVESRNTTEWEYFRKNLINNIGFDVNSLSDNSLFRVQQCVFWHYTNGKDCSNYSQLGLFSNEEQQYYNKLIKKADANSNYTSSSSVVVSVTKDSSCKLQSDGRIGPFNLNNDSKKINRLTASVSGFSGGFKFVDEQGNEISEYNNYKGKFYIKPNNNINQAQYNISVTINLNYYKTIPSVYWQSGYQPILTIRREAGSSAPATYSSKYSAQMDLALKKQITKINNQVVDSSVRSLNVGAGMVVHDAATTAVYNMRKDPINVESGDIITYKIQIFNESKELDSYAKEITDYIPEGLTFVPSENNANNNWKLYNSNGSEITWSPSNYSESNLANVAYIKSTKLADTQINKLTDEASLVNNSKYVEVELKVDNNVNGILTNVAEITRYGYKLGNNFIEATTNGIDRDSIQNNLSLAADLTDYYGGARSKVDPNEPSNYPGQQDDDDFEKVKVENYIDLALKKTITEVENSDGKVNYTRFKNADPAPLKAGETTANYFMDKATLNVTQGDIVTYRIYVFNEGTINATAREITDYLPENLEYLPNDSINKKYGWVSSTQDTNGITAVTTKYLTGKFIDKYTVSMRESGAEINSNYVEIRCRVKEDATPDTRLVNIAEITQYQTETETPTNDRDSGTTGTDKVTLPAANAWKEYVTSTKDDVDTTADGFEAWLGQQDDDDFEAVVVNKMQEFDLALRKFITEVNDEAVDVSRVPEINYTPLINGGTAAYKHTKQAVMVNGGDTVTYTIRIYNEGDIAGRATEITDYLPDGLEFLPNDSLNVQYGWRAVTGTNNRTVKTQYFSNKDNIPANTSQKEFVSNCFVDVKIKCKVSNDKAKEKLYLTNRAEITGHIDENGNYAKIAGVDRDSIPENVKSEHESTMLQYTNQTYSSDVYYPGYEDDDDKETVYVLPTTDFKLKLLKVKKEDLNAENPTSLGDATFTIRETVQDEYGDAQEEELSSNTYSSNNGIIQVADRQKVRGGKIYRYSIVEDHVPDGFERITEDPVTVIVMVDQELNVNYRLIYGDEGDAIGENVKLSNNGNEITVRYANPPKEFDLALRKNISKVERNGVEIDTSSIFATRDPIINIYSYSAWASTNTMAQYHTKEALKIKKGDVITYTINISNEGAVKGYATKITDYLPAGLALANTTLNTQNEWTTGTTSNGVTEVYTTKLSSTLLNECQVRDFILGKETTTWTASVQIQCVVTKDPTNQIQYLTNRAEITEDKAVSIAQNGTETVLNIEDRDSTPENVLSGHSSEMLNYDANEEYDRNTYYKGFEDDDDKETLYLEPIGDLGFTLNKVDSDTGESIKANFTIEHAHENGGKVYATKLPNGEVNGTYSFTENSVEINDTYYFKIKEDSSQEGYINLLGDNYIVACAYLDESLQVVNNKKISEGQNASSEDTYFNEYGYVIYNNAGSILTENDTDLYGKVRVEANNTGASKGITITVQNKKEDNRVFDLALRKYIEKVEKADGTSTDYTSTREPKLKNTSVIALNRTGTAKYYHEKQAVKVETNDIITYTIRVYNESDLEGKVGEIVDYLPSGLELYSSTVDGVDYGWTQTTNADGTKTLTTHYLQDTELKETNIRKEMVGQNNGDFHADVKVKLKVTETAGTSLKYLTNRAEITAAEDAKGNKYGTYYNETNNSDRDSTPNTIKDSLNLSNHYKQNVLDVDVKDYYPGTQDDDDFETVYIENETEFSLELIKRNYADNSVVTENIQFTIQELKENTDIDNITSNDIISTETKNITGSGNLTSKQNVKVDSTHLYRVMETVISDNLQQTVGSVVVRVTVREDGTAYAQIRKVNSSSWSSVYSSSYVSIGTDFTGTNKFVLTLKNEPIGKYRVELEKVDENGRPITNIPASFRIQSLISNTSKPVSTNSEGKIVVQEERKIYGTNQEDKYSFSEVTAPQGYAIANGSGDLIVKTKKEGNTYVVDRENTYIRYYEPIEGGYRTSIIHANETVDGYGFTIEDGDVETVKIKVTNTKISGKYQIQIAKVNEDGNIIQTNDAIFTMQNNASANEAAASERQQTVKGIATFAETDFKSPGVVDEYTITEYQAPAGYIKSSDTILFRAVSKALNSAYVFDEEHMLLAVNGKPIARSERLGEFNDDENVGWYLDDEGSTPIITIFVKNVKITGKYRVELEKVDNNGNPIKNNPASFYIQGLVQNTNKPQSTNSEGKIVVQDLRMFYNEEQNDTYTISEFNAPQGYLKFDGEITLNVKAKVSNNKYVIDTTNSKVLVNVDGETREVPLNTRRNGIGFYLVNGDTPTIKIQVANDELAGKYSVKIAKVDENGDPLEIEGTEFVYKKNRGNYTSAEQKVSLVNGVGTIADKEAFQGAGDIVQYTINEKTAPTGYIRFEDNIYLNITSKSVDSSYVINDERTELIVRNHIVTRSTIPGAFAEGESVAWYLDDSGEIPEITIYVKNTPITGKFNLQVTKVDSITGEEIPGVTFGGLDYKQVPLQPATTNSDGIAVIDTDVNIEREDAVFTYVLDETSVPQGYTRIQYNRIVVTIYARLSADGKSYTVNNIKTGTTRSSGGEDSDREKAMLEKGLRANIVNGDTPTVNVIIPNPPTVDYHFSFHKVNADTGRAVRNAVFDIEKPNGTKERRTLGFGVFEDLPSNVQIAKSYIYTFEEISVPDPYINVFEGFKIRVEIYINDKGKADKAKSSVRLLAPDDYDLTNEENRKRFESAEECIGELEIDDENYVTLDVKNPTRKVDFGLELVKHSIGDKNNEVVGAKFAVKRSETEDGEYQTINSSLEVQEDSDEVIDNVSQAETGKTYYYDVEETSAPGNYVIRVKNVRFKVVTKADGTIETSIDKVNILSDTTGEFEWKNYTSDMAQYVSLSQPDANNKSTLYVANTIKYTLELRKFMKTTYLSQVNGGNFIVEKITRGTNNEISTEKIYEGSLYKDFEFKNAAPNSTYEFYIQEVTPLTAQETGSEALNNDFENVKIHIQVMIDAEGNIVQSKRYTKVVDIIGINGKTVTKSEKVDLKSKVSFTFTGNIVQVRIADTPVVTELNKYSFQLVKIDSVTEEPIKDIEFMVMSDANGASGMVQYDADQNTAGYQNPVTDEDGIITIGNLAIDGYQTRNTFLIREETGNPEYESLIGVQIQVVVDLDGVTDASDITLDRITAELTGQNAQNFRDRGVVLTTRVTKDNIVQIVVPNIPNRFNFTLNKRDGEGNLLLADANNPNNGAVISVTNTANNDIIVPEVVLADGTVTKSLNCAADTEYVYLITEHKSKYGYSNAISGCTVLLRVVVDSNGVVKDVGDDGTRLDIRNYNPHANIDLDEVRRNVTVDVQWVDGVRTVIVNITNEPEYRLQLNKVDTDGNHIHNVKLTAIKVVSGVETETKYLLQGHSPISSLGIQISEGEEQTWRIREESVVKPYYNVLDNNKYFDVKVKFENGKLKLISQGAYNADGTEARVIQNTLKAELLENKNMLNITVVNPVKYSVTVRKVEESEDGTLTNINGAVLHLEQKNNGVVSSAGNSLGTIENVVSINDIHYLTLDETSAPRNHKNILEGKYIEVATWIGTDKKLHTLGPNVYYTGEGSKESRLVPTSDDVYSYIQLTDPANGDDGYQQVTLSLTNPIDYIFNIKKVKTDTNKTELPGSIVIVNNDNELRISDGLFSNSKEEEIKVGEEKTYKIRELKSVGNHVNILEDKEIEVKVTATTGGNISIVSKHVYDVSSDEGRTQLSEAEENEVFEYVTIEKGTDSESGKQTINVSIENPVGYILDIYKVKSDNTTGLVGPMLTLGGESVIDGTTSMYSTNVTGKVDRVESFRIRETSTNENYRNVLGIDRDLLVMVAVDSSEKLQLAGVYTVEDPYKLTKIEETDVKDYINVLITDPDANGLQHVEVRIQNPKEYKISLDKFKADGETELKGAVIKLNGEVVISGDNSHAELTREIKMGDTYRIEVEEDSTLPGKVNILENKKLIVELFVNENEDLITTQKVVNKDDEYETPIEDENLLKYLTVRSSINSNEVKIALSNPDEFNLELVKVDKDTRERMNDVTFDVTVEDEFEDEITFLNSKTFEPINFAELKTSNIDGEDGKIVIPNILIEEEGKYIFTFHETRVYGYVEPLDIKAEVTIEKVDGSYKVTGINVLEGNVNTQNVIVTEEEPETIIIEAENERLKGSYDLKLNKVDKLTNKKIDGAEFTVTAIKDGEEYTLYKSTNNVTDKEVIVPATLEVKNGIASIQNIRMDKEETYIIKLEETGSPDKYLDLEEPIEIEVVIGAEGNKYVLKSARIANENKLAAIKNDSKTVEVTIANEQFDLSLRKFISKVISAEGTEQAKEVEIASREPKVVTDALINKTAQTAVYNHTKEPVAVETGDTVIYTLRVYNEGDRAGYAEVVTDYLPEGLEFINDEFNAGYGWLLDETDPELRTIRTNYLSKEKNEDNIIEAFNIETGKLDYKDIQIKCKVKADVKGDTKLTNIAEITKFTDKNGDIVVDRDSTGGNVNVPTGEDLANYKDSEIESGKEYIEGNEDDDDFEKVVVAKFDFSLRKFITKVISKEGTEEQREAEITSREPQVVTDALKDKYSQTATYNHTKEPVRLKVGDTIIYTLRVYNEGDRAGYVKTVTDYLPEGLEFVDDEFNKAFGWTVDETGRKVTTNYLSKDSNVENIIEAYDSESDKLDYKDIQIKCRVKTGLKANTKLTNIAEITESTNRYGYNVTDRDSTGGNINVPKGEDLANYKDSEIESGKQYIEGNEDDDDFEKVIIEEFDLALRKFITGITNGFGEKSEVKDRIPVFVVNEDGNYVYNHTKEPVLVANQNIVEYTLRVYNEGTMDGYASVIKDDIPEGLEFLPNEALNEEYRWVMLDENGKETEDVSKAKFIVTDYLSKEQETAKGSNLLKAFDTVAYEAGAIKEPDYKEVKVAFKVTMPNTSDRIIVNKAQITDDTDKDGNKVDDIDSTPDVWNEGEDDQDIEKVKVQYFDLSLRKWVTKAIVIEDGKETVRETGHKAEDEPEETVKVDLQKSKLGNVVVKFEYQIRVTNDGEIAGEATEVSDYIPEGLRFVAADNPDWIEKDGKVYTNKLAGTTLKTGESAEVTILLTWINKENNMGLKINTAEISKDHNKYGSPDKDSIPGNKAPKDVEDDIDDAPVMLTVKTGEPVVYVGITLAVLTVLAGGIAVIKMNFKDTTKNSSKN